MGINIVTAKYEVTFPFNIVMGEKVSNTLIYEWSGLGKAVIYAPELVDIKKLKEGHYESRMRIEVILDLNKKPAELTLDHFYVEKCFQALLSFLIEVWLTSKIPEINPIVRPEFITCKYYDSAESPFINPDTGRSSYEAPMPRGLVLSKDNWKEIASNLLAGKRRYLNEILLLDAKCMIYENRPEIAILLAAIACEYKVKYVCDILAKKKKVPKKLWSTVVDKLRLSRTEYQAIMSSLGITSMKTSHDPKIKALPSRLDHLFEHRNTIAHRGSIQGYKGKQFTATEVTLLAKADIETAEQFVDWLDLQVAAIN